MKKLPVDAMSCLWSGGTYSVTSVELRSRFEFRAARSGSSMSAQLKQSGFHARSSPASLSITSPRSSPFGSSGWQPSAHSDRPHAGVDIFRRLGTYSVGSAHQVRYGGEVRMRGHGP